MKKELRRKVHNKYGSRCAYCGKLTKYKDMQVDHIIPKNRFGNFSHVHKNAYKVDHYENLTPACRICNHYKRVYTVEEFRKVMLKLHSNAAGQYLVKVMINYGMINIKPFDGVFYFERGKGG